MKRTSAGVLIIAAVLGVAAGFLVDQLLTSAGSPTFTPAVTLPILLVLLGVVVIALAVPIRRATHGTAKTTVDPFRAVRSASSTRPAPGSTASGSTASHGPSTKSRSAARGCGSSRRGSSLTTLP